MSSRTKRIIAFFFLINIVFETISPTAAWALTSGPSQPEVQAFTPVGTSEMVNVFTGDFNYNIPLLDVEGYPINLAYNSNVGNDEEASWVGLGWNINPGTINRNMRGLPDDFSGDIIEKEITMKPNQTFGVGAEARFEIFGKDPKFNGSNVALSFGLNYNTYNGYGVDIGADISMKVANGDKGRYGGSLGINSGSGQGLGLTADVSYDKKINDVVKKEFADERFAGGGVGLSINSITGLKEISFHADASRRAMEGNNKVGYSRNKNGKISKVGSVGATLTYASPSYFPGVDNEMTNMGLTFNVSLGGEVTGTHPKAFVSAYYSGQFIRDKTKSYEAYGYLNSGKANNGSSKTILHDFNREKDGVFTLNTPHLPVTNYTYDNFSYTGQGNGGNFRPYRNQIGTVFDPRTENIPEFNGSFGIEVGAGNAVHLGANAHLSMVTTKTKKWKNYNTLEAVAEFKDGAVLNSSTENTYFKESGEFTPEVDPGYFTNVINGFNPVAADLYEVGPDAIGTDKLKTKNNTYNQLNTSNNQKTARVKKDQSLSILTGAQAAVAALNPVIIDYPDYVSTSNPTMFYASTNGGYTNPNTFPTIPRIGNSSYPYPKAHHISEITTTRDDGARYVYGIPAYNISTEETSFSVEGVSPDYINGEVDYSPTPDASLNNNKGLEHFYSSQKIPAYAHSYLLTGVLSSDYVDRTGDGPTKDDLGKYTRFNYSMIAPDYQWRVPYGKNNTSSIAALSEGLHSKTGASGDDKANYTYGKKNIWLLHSIETKNYVAVFVLGDRYDAYEADQQDGGLWSGATAANNKSKMLSEIKLYSRQELLDKGSNAIPLKVVHFDYDYSLCPNVPNNTGQTYNKPGDNTNYNSWKGKLTLKKVWFTYQGVEKGKLSPYQFTYGVSGQTGTNPDYAPKNYDRWGNYKPNPSSPYDPMGNTTPSNIDFPYTNSHDANIDYYESAYNLTQIKLPSGGEIKVVYEADDYAYVQNKKAMEMFIVDGAVQNESNKNASIGTDLFSNAGGTNYNMFAITVPADVIAEFNKRKAANPSMSNDELVRKMFFQDENGVDMKYMYFRFLMNIERNVAGYNPKYEFVNGYVEVDYSGFNGPQIDLTTSRIFFKVKNVTRYDNVFSSAQINPITMAGINFVRRYYPQVAFDNYQDPFTSVGTNALALLSSIKSAFTPIVQFFKGGLTNALILSNASQGFRPARSYFRLYSPTQFKKGGGSRVKQLYLNDKWTSVSGNSNNTEQVYGQEYTYKTKDDYGNLISSGVATYEPLMGGDENPWKQPIFYEEKHLLAHDDSYLMEEPLGEALFPGPSVGYSQVIVRNLTSVDIANNLSNFNRHNTGAVVHEFYTAKDFPTLTDNTGIIKKRHKPNPILKFLKFLTKDYMTTSEGFQIVLNDMHGKPRAQWVFGQPKSGLTLANQLEGYMAMAKSKQGYISGVEYKYKTDGNGGLDNTVNIINKNGQIQSAMIGVDYDMVMDTKESRTVSNVVETQGNLEGFVIGLIPMAVPTIYPGFKREKVQYRRSVVTKVLTRYGILEETIAYDNGASVSTRNKLFDGETGAVLLSETVNNFNDKVYNLTYPAHWAYDRMGLSSINQGISVSIVGGVVTNPQLLIEGDEVILATSNYASTSKAWVYKTSPAVQMMDINGTLINLSNWDMATVTRSGNRNQHGIPVAKVVSLGNPVSGNQLVLNNSTKVIDASAAEFKDNWPIFCNCGFNPGEIFNPFITGQKGNFRPSVSYAYLTGREQSKQDQNTNIRKDGPYKTFVPFWTANTSVYPYNWVKTTDPAWQYVNKMTIYSPYGMELENMDALGRYSSAIYGYNNALPVAVSSNAKYKQIGFDNFEDYDYRQPCDNNHFTYMQYSKSSTSYTYGVSGTNDVKKSSTNTNQRYSHTGRRSFKITAGSPNVILTKTITTSCN